MNKCILVFFAVFSTSLFAQQAAPASETKPQAETTAPVHKTYRQFDAEVKDGTYHNRYFGFAYTIPEGWDSHDEETKQRLLEIGKDQLKDEKLRNQQTGPEQGFFFLLMATPKDAMIPQVNVMAQDVVLIPQIKTGADFIELLGTQFKQQPNYSLLKETAKFPIAGQEFYRSDFKNGPVFQTAIFTVMRRHAVGFIVSATREEDLQSVIKTVENTKFETPKDMVQ